jgi:hypothetical protein
LPAERLDEAAEEAVFRPDPLVPEESQGEPVDTLIRPQDIEDVLRVAGGGRPIRPDSSHTRTPLREETPGPGGIGAGPEVTQLAGEERAALLGCPRCDPRLIRLACWSCLIGIVARIP